MLIDIMKQFPQPPVDFECEKSFWGKMTKLQDEISGSVVKETRNDAGKGRGYNYASEADVYPKIVEATLKHEMNVVLAAHLPTDTAAPAGHASFKKEGTVREEYAADLLTILVIRITDLQTGYYRYFFHTNSIPPEAYKTDGVAAGNKLIGNITRSYRNALTKIFLAAGDPKDDADYGEKTDEKSDTIKIVAKPTNNTTEKLNTIKNKIFNELLSQGYPGAEIPQFLTGLITLTPEITNTLETVTEADCEILYKEITKAPTPPEIS